MQYCTVVYSTVQYLGVCFIVQDSDPVEVVKVQQYCIVVYSTVQYSAVQYLGVCFIVSGP